MSLNRWGREGKGLDWAWSEINEEEVWKRGYSVWVFLLGHLCSGSICSTSEPIEALKGIIATGAQTKSFILILGKSMQNHTEDKRQQLWIRQLLIPADPTWNPEEYGQHPRMFTSDVTYTLHDNAHSSNLTFRAWMKLATFRGHLSLRVLSQTSDDYNWVTMLTDSIMGRGVVAGIGG